MPGPILDELYLRFVWRPTGAQFIQDGAQGLHHLQVGALAVAADCMDAGARVTQEQLPPILQVSPTLPFSRINSRSPITFRFRVVPDALNPNSAHSAF